MNSIIYDDEINPIENYIWGYYYDFLKKLDKKHCVKFALFCAKIVNSNTKESNLCIELVEKWLKDENSISKEKLWNAATDTTYTVANAVANAIPNAIPNAVANFVAYAAYYAAYPPTSTSYAVDAVYSAIYAYSAANTAKINKYLQILFRKTKQFQNNKILDQISKNDVDKLELVDWNMITDIMLEEYNIVNEFEYKDIFSRRCLIELLRREYL